MFVGSSCHLEGAKALSASGEIIRQAISKFYKRESIKDTHIYGNSLQKCRKEGISEIEEEFV